ncbi:MAG: hypothetical protein ACI841_000476, partial [Planctomycetota bacterium]
PGALEYSSSKRSERNRERRSACGHDVITMRTMTLFQSERFGRNAGR